MTNFVLVTEVQHGVLDKIIQESVFIDADEISSIAKPSEGELGNTKLLLRDGESIWITENSDELNSMING